MDEQNFSIDIDTNYVNINKKELASSYNEFYEDEDNRTKAIYDVKECINNEIRLDNYGYINVSIGDENLQLFGNAKLTDDELLDLYDSIKEYFNKKVEKINKILNIVKDDE